MKRVNISELIWKISQSKLYHIDQHRRESSQELLDSQFYHEKLVILLLYTVSDVTKICISFKL